MYGWPDTSEETKRKLIKCSNSYNVSCTLACNLACPGDQVWRERGSTSPSQFFADTSIASSSFAPLLEDP